MKPVRVAAAVLAVVVLAGSFVLTLARALGSDALFWVLATSLVPFATIGYLVALLLLALVVWRWPWGRGRIALLAAMSVAVLGLGVHVWWLAPSYVGHHAPGKPTLTVLELNMLKGNADPAATARLIRQQRPALVVLTEVTPGALAGVAHDDGVGRGSSLPHVSGEALPDASGVVVASRYPLSLLRTLPLTHPGYVVRVAAPKPFTVLAAHTAQPGIDVVAWRQDHALIARQLRTIRGPHLLVGDLNATLDHAPLRRLLASGMADAAQQANSGWQPTWPSPARTHFRRLPLPFGMVAIDHVLEDDHFSAVSTSTYEVPRTDHLALVARLVQR